ncbi:MAG: restriction endonuclease subunit S, partial [Mariniphaga sp.]
MEKELPKGWVETSIDEINFKKSQSINPENYTEDTFELYSVPIFEYRRPEIVKGSEIGSTKQIVEEGEVLLCKINPRINRVWQVGNFSDHRKIASSEWIVVNPRRFIDTTFLKFLFSAPFFRTVLQSEVSGVGGSLTRARPKIVENYKFPLPPLPEQQRIVAKLDMLFGHLDALKTRLERIPQLLKEFRQKVLTQAVTGKLTEEWREGRELEECDLDYFCESSFYGPRFSTEEYSASGYPTVRTTDMTDNGFISIGFNTPRVSIQDKKKIELYKINSGDLLITRTGSIGKMARYIGEEIAIPSAYLIRFRFNEKALTDFIYYCLTSPDGQNQMGLSSTAITQPNLNAQKIRALKIPNLPIEEQKEIVHRVESLFAKADQIEAGYQKLKAKVEQLP